MKRIGNLFNRIISYENLVRLQKALIEDTYRNWQIFPVEARGIDFIGYVFYHGHTLLRKDIKKKFIYKLGYKSKNKRLTSLAAYWGWCKYGNCHNLKIIDKNY